MGTSSTSLAVRVTASRVLSHGDGRGEDGGGLDGDLDVELTREQVESGSVPRTSLALLRTSLSVLTALSANSPFWHGYASYRTQVWARWPTAGAPAAFGSPAEYDRVVELLERSGAAMDDGMIYYDARLSHDYPTLEPRVADAWLSVDDAVLLAALSRSLVTTSAAEWPAGARRTPGDAARGGVAGGTRRPPGELLDPVTGALVTARGMVDRLIARVARHSPRRVTWRRSVEWWTTCSPAAPVRSGNVPVASAWTDYRRGGSDCAGTDPDSSDAVSATEPLLG
ncbi:glutamate-cysteine ligase family protein [Frankia sp. Mgl5]|uniref:carboxylate-amine ligase n=1 Tax=Frankia sp. Mgl5 TaxID=2933793 RepID=UPI00200D8A0C|nr:glutamate-cysteine ligase family protein [Frankia sp. Mgl5]MCK9927668.1 glutamate-cysteine ligase family protein [Frankia sp. Mgl5]